MKSIPNKNTFREKRTMMNKNYFKRDFYNRQSGGNDLQIIIL
jgi:hypothetical protein